MLCAIDVQRGLRWKDCLAGGVRALLRWLHANPAMAPGAGSDCGCLALSAAPLAAAPPWWPRAAAADGTATDSASAHVHEEAIWAAITTPSELPRSDELTRAAQFCDRSCELRLRGEFAAAAAAAAQCCELAPGWPKAWRVPSRLPKQKKAQAWQSAHARALTPVGGGQGPFGVRGAAEPSPRRLRARRATVVD